MQKLSVRVVEIKESELKKFFTEFWNVSIEKINDDLKLNDENLENFTSIKFFQFIAAIESNFNVKINNVNSIITFKDILKNIEK